MLRGAIICPDRELGDRLVSALLDTHRIGIVRRLESYPNAVELARFMRAAVPEVVFVSIGNRAKRAFDILSRMEKDRRRDAGSSDQSCLRSTDRLARDDAGGNS